MLVGEHFIASHIYFAGKCCRLQSVFLGFNCKRNEKIQQKNGCQASRHNDMIAFRFYLYLLLPLLFCFQLMFIPSSIYPVYSGISFLKTFRPYFCEIMDFYLCHNSNNNNYIIIIMVVVLIIIIIILLLKQCFALPKLNQQQQHSTALALARVYVSQSHPIIPAFVLYT